MRRVKFVDVKNFVAGGEGAQERRRMIRNSAADGNPFFRDETRLMAWKRGMQEKIRVWVNRRKDGNPFFSKKDELGSLLKEHENFCGPSEMKAIEQQAELAEREK